MKFSVHSHRQLRRLVGAGECEDKRQRERKREFGGNICSGLPNWGRKGNGKEEKEKEENGLAIYALVHVVLA